MQWELAKMFCQGANAHQASRKLGVAYGTAYKHLKLFEMTFRRLRHPTAKAVISIRNEKNTIPERWQKVAMKLLYLNLVNRKSSTHPNPEPSGDYLMIS